ncbi:MAG: carboxylesterase/lipase family protein [Microthrixaceae bacterium]
MSGPIHSGSLHGDRTGATPVVVETEAGRLAGSRLQGVTRFAGIPYARPPLGDLRFRPPQPPEPWTGVRPAEHFAPTAPQNPSMMDMLFGGVAEPWDEDCLYLNVWTPDVAPTSPLPVMVWIHGGGFEIGSGSSPLYDGTRFTANEVVLVTCNYRLGALGFLELGDLDPGYRGSGNCGLMDQEAALRWVRHNIAAFGGDPRKVTVFGQSAGSMSIAAHLASGRGKALFDQAITQSGAANAARSIDAAEIDRREFFDEGGWSSVADVVAAPVDALLAAHGVMAGARVADPEAFVRKSGTPIGFLSFRPVADGIYLPVDPLEAIASGSAAGIPIVAGTTLEEWRLFAMMTPPAADTTALERRVATLVADPDTALDAYRHQMPEATFSDIESAILTDMVFRAPISAMVDAQRPHAPSYQYRWDWRSPAFGGLIGAAHAVELPFVFDVLHDRRLEVFVGPDAPASLARSINQAWSHFAIEGAPRAPGLPDWPDVSGSVRPVAVFDDEPRLDEDPQHETLDFWRSPGATAPIAG